MTEHELRALIREVIGELIRPPQLRVLVVFTGGLLGFDEAIDSLAALKATGAHLDYRQTPSAERILDQAKIAEIGMVHASESLVQAHDMLILPNATVNLIAKVTHGVGDCLASNVLAEFLMSNRPVVVAVNAACPDSADKRGWFPEMPAGYQEMLRANLATLKSFGARLTTTERLDHAVRTVRRPTEQLRPATA